MIEANPKSFAKLQRNSEKDEVMNSAVCKDKDVVHLVQDAAVSGVLEFMSPAFVRKWHPNINKESLPNNQM